MTDFGELLIKNFSWDLPHWWHFFCSIPCFCFSPTPTYHFPTLPHPKNCSHSYTCLTTSWHLLKCGEMHYRGFTLNWGTYTSTLISTDCSTRAACDIWTCIFSLSWEKDLLNTKIWNKDSEQNWTAFLSHQ